MPVHMVQFLRLHYNEGLSWYEELADHASIHMVQFLHGHGCITMKVRISMLHASIVYHRSVVRMKVEAGILNTWFGNGSVIYVYRKTIGDAPTWILNW